ncbi:MAG: tyrosine-type recombinase/integrase, partial [Anaerolineaceae bacterium]
DVLAVHNIDAEKDSPADVPENAITWLVDTLRYHAAATERVYITAVAGFYEFLAAENLAPINLARIQLLIRRRARKPGIRLPQFPRNEIDEIVEYLSNITNLSSEDAVDRLRNLRDRALLITLADTGLRIHDACNLRRGDMDWNEGRTLVVGKGNRQAVVRFSPRALAALKDYLQERASLDGASGKPLSALPLFARHDNGAGSKVKPITPTSGRNIVNDWVGKILGGDAVGRITPHSFRHYFVTEVLLASGNLKLAQELARHTSITVTQRYAHLSEDELDKGYWEIFAEKEKKG